MRSFAAGVAYVGHAFQGWQRQPTGGGVANVVESALSDVANMPILTQCAGRTDAGVHALQQVIHFTCETAREAEHFLRGANALLPETVKLLWVRLVPEDFHARFSAKARHYRYWMALNPVPLPHWHGRVLSLTQPIDIAAMQAAAMHIHGEQDYRIFRSSECQSSHAMRCVYHCEVTKRSDMVHIDIVANAFLHHMVRFIVGGLLAVGERKATPEVLKEAIQSKVRPPWVRCVSPAGLYFVRPIYSCLEIPMVLDPLTQEKILSPCPGHDGVLK
jgi:tRNA pseudouridine38-40 synthase